MPFGVLRTWLPEVDFRKLLSLCLNLPFQREMHQPVKAYLNYAPKHSLHANSFCIIQFVAQIFSLFAINFL